MLAAMDGVEPQLNAHIGIAKNNGVSDAQAAEILSIVSDEVRGGAATSPFPFGAENTAYAKYFSGKSYLARLSGGQILIAVGGRGFYQEKGKPARELKAGDIVEIAPNVVHWHGAAPDSWFSHLAIECKPDTNKNTWLEAVSDEEYERATSGK